MHFIRFLLTATRSPTLLGLSGFRLKTARAVTPIIKANPASADPTISTTTMIMFDINFTIFI